MRTGKLQPDRTPAATVAAAHSCYSACHSVWASTHGSHCESQMGGLNSHHRRRSLVACGRASYSQIELRLPPWLPLIVAILPVTACGPRPMAPTANLKWGALTRTID